MTPWRWCLNKSPSISLMQAPAALDFFSPFALSPVLPLLIVALARCARDTIDSITHHHILYYTSLTLMDTFRDALHVIGNWVEIICSIGRSTTNRWYNGLLHSVPRVLLFFRKEREKNFAIIVHVWFALVSSGWFRMCRNVYWLTTAIGVQKRFESKPHEEGARQSEKDQNAVIFNFRTSMTMILLNTISTVSNEPGLQTTFLAWKHKTTIK